MRGAEGKVAPRSKRCGCCAATLTLHTSQHRTRTEVQQATQRSRDAHGRREASHPALCLARAPTEDTQSAVHAVKARFTASSYQAPWLQCSDYPQRCPQRSVPPYV